jgi:rare lipoprotein A
MKKLVMGCAVAGLIALSPKSEAKLPTSIGRMPYAMPPAKSIHPLTVLPLKEEFGLASWYGEECSNLPTASGEAYNMNGLTAAHRQLPLGTTVEVTNLRNQRSVLLRINDRGPGIPGRLIDVSWAAAKRLGFVHAGLAPVRVQVVRYPKNSGAHRHRGHAPELN